MIRNRTNRSAGRPNRRRLRAMTWRAILRVLSKVEMKYVSSCAIPVSGDGCCTRMGSNPAA